MIERSSWDSETFGLNVGRVADAGSIPSAGECRAFEHISVKVPQDRLDLVNAYEEVGFRVVTVDYELERRSGHDRDTEPRVPIERVARRAPGFEVSGFTVPGSRLMLDPVLRARMPGEFWDRMIVNHCRQFADFCLCAVREGRLEGFVSCFERDQALELFLVAVHPRAAGQGVGGALMREAFRLAAGHARKLVTNVISQNTTAMRFYFRRGFLPARGDFVLHYSNVRSS